MERALPDKDRVRDGGVVCEPVLEAGQKVKGEGVFLQRKISWCSAREDKSEGRTKPTYPMKKSARCHPSSGSQNLIVGLCQGNYRQDSTFKKSIAS